MAVSIAGASGSPEVPSLPAIAQAEQEVTEMRPIKTMPPSLSLGGTELADSTVYWAAWAIPALAIVGAVVWRRRRALQVAARAEALRNSALPDAQAALARAVASGTDPRVAASEAVLSYLTARLGTQATGLTREALLHRLRETGGSHDLKDRVGEVLAAGESARFTPQTGGPVGTGDHAERASRLLDELEGAINA